MEMIQESLQQSKRDFDSFLEENVQMNWDAQRRKIYDHFGLGDAYENAPQNLGASRNLRGAFGKSTAGSRSLGSSKMQFGTTGLHKSVLGGSVNAALKASMSADAQEKSQIANSHGALEELASRDKQERYSAKIVELNEARNQNQCYPLLHQLASVEDQASEQSADFIVNSYQAVIQLVEEQKSTLRRNDPAVVSCERKFTQGYVNEAPNSPAAMAMRKQIINASRKCLERMFWSKIDGIISKDPKVANPGGIPQPINKVRAYIRVRAQRKELVTHASGQDEGVGTLQQITTGSESDYCWVLIFYLLRCGLIKEAAQYVSDNQRAIRSLDRHFGKYVEAYAGDADRRLSAELRQEIQTNYYGRTRIAPENQVDPYRIACYKVIGRCELSRKTLDNIPVDEEDWMWLQFALAREVNRAEEAAGETFGLEELRQIVADIEKRHFNSTSDQAGNHGTLFFLQILSGMYEQAIASLYSHNHVAAVHFAIGLAYYGLLRVADLSTEEIRKYPLQRIMLLTLLVSRNTRDEPILQFALLVGCFTASFRSAKPDVATDYLVLLALNADLPGEGGRRQGRLCLDALRELVLETREFAQLLGDIRSDGQKIPGAIQLRAKLIQRSVAGERDTELAKFIKDLTVQAALAADEGGRTTDAVLLYHLAEEYDNVLAIVNRTLSEALTVELGRQAMRIEPLKPRESKSKEPQSQSTLSLTAVDDPVVLAKNMYDLYSAASRQNVYQRIKPATREATATLVQMAMAKQNLLAHNYLAALEAIGSLDLLPLNASGDVSVIRQYAQNFAQLPAVVGRCVGDVLVWAVLACNGERDRLVRDGWEVDGRRNMVLRLNNAVADVGIFAGLVRYKLRQEVFDTLARAGDGS
jgi:nuclear pore complex protein Nup93